MRRLLKKFVFLFYKVYAVWMIGADRTYTYKGMKLQVPTGVFHPGLFFSTKFLIEQLALLPIKNKTLLELGCGSGLISMAAAQQGAKVTAVDINPKAVDTTRANAAQNSLQVQVLLSDLFTNLKGVFFDYIVINPPYFKRLPKDDADLAWFCGPNMEYFTALFTTLAPHLHTNSMVLMVLSEDCDIQGIKTIAAQNGFTLALLAKKDVWFEENYVFTINAKT